MINECLISDYEIVMNMIVMISGTIMQILSIYDYSYDFQSRYYADIHLVEIFN